MAEQLRRRLCGRGPLGLLTAMPRPVRVLLSVVSGMTAAATQSPAAEPGAFTVGNYPVEARADNAVAAKSKALTIGQRRAFRSLVKRLAPVTAHKAIARLQSVPVEPLIGGIAVRAERNSSTSYIATLDFTFEPQRVRKLLIERGIPFVDEQAAQTAVVLIYVPPTQASSEQWSASRGEALWREAWTGLDLKHALTPVKLHRRPQGLTPGLVKAALNDPEAPLGVTAPLSRSRQALLAIAEPDPAANRLNVTLSGTDAVGSFVLRRSWRLDPTDPLYSAEYAAVVALGIIEGRWKAVKARPAPPLPPVGSPPLAVQISVRFAGLREWQEMRSQIERLPGVTNLLVGGLSARGAQIALRYPGGGPALAAALRTQGIIMSGSRGVWYAQADRH